MAALNLPGLPFALSPEGNPPPGCRVLNGALILSAAANTDMFVDPGHDSTLGPRPDSEPVGTADPASPVGTADPASIELPDAGRLMGLPPAGDFSLSAKVTVGFASTFDAGVLLLYAAERRWAKLCFEYSPQNTPMAVTVVTRETSDDSNSFEVAGNTLWLRITRTGAAWAFHASTDGEWWRMVRYFTLGGTEPVRIGFLPQSPTGKGCDVTYEDITFTRGAPENLRDGS